MKRKFSKYNFFNKNHNITRISVTNKNIEIFSMVKIIRKCLQLFPDYINHRKLFVTFTHKENCMTSTLRWMKISLRKT